LVLDRDGGDFYRYYEYRVIRDKKFLGAIRIPAYRRTENFATAEVHLYSNDEKTYTIHPTGWGKFVSENSSLDINGKFIQSIDYSNNMNKNFIYTVMLNYLSDKFASETRSLPQIPEHIAQESMNTMIGAFETDNDAIRELKSRNKGDELPSSIHNKAKDYYKRENTSEYKDGLKTYAQVMAKYDVIIELMNNPELDNINKVNLDEFFRTTYLEFIRSYFKLMSSSTQQDVIVKILKEFYWLKIENLSYNNDQVLIQNYSIDEIFTEYFISPYVISKEFEQSEYLKEENLANLMLTVIPQKIGFIIDNQNYTIMTFIPPTEQKRTIDRDQALDYLQGNLDKINQNINNAIDKDNSEEFNELFDFVLNQIINGIHIEGWTQGANWIKNFLRSDFGQAIVKYTVEGLFNSLFQNTNLIESFIDNIVPMTTGCIKLNAINKKLQANGIEKLSEKDSKDIWFLERMCAILGEISLEDLKDFDPNKPIESVIKLLGPVLKVYMESIYYAMSRSCDRWNIRATYHDLPAELKKIGLLKDEKGNILISIGDVYPVNMEGTLGALHHSWYGTINPEFIPIKTSFISTRGAFCYWRYAWAKKRYGLPTYTDW
ncbi:MAG: hypothetical protein ACRCTQ_00470, partial [Brevinemataceae bacterium]